LIICSGFHFSLQQWSKTWLVLIWGVWLCQSVSQILLYFFNNLESLVKCPDLLCRTRHIQLRCTGLMYKKSITGKQE
jgi:hypothetical protein